ncbi:MAG: GrpB family protein [Clostridiales bacterium]|nr:GrpB family protein [Clostridiales bacterium]
MLGCKNKIVQLKPYDKLWIELYESEKNKIINQIDNYIVSIEHIGSTSIKNLIAKPIIDIVISLNSVKKYKKIARKMVDIGYEFKGEGGISGRLFFIKQDSSRTYFHVHAFINGSQEYINHILFRDYLRVHHLYTDDYSKLKLQLFEKFENDRLAYTEGKNEFIKKILVKARNKYEKYQKEYNQPFKGWDFSYIKKRMTNEEVDWKYQKIIEKYLPNINCLLDMGTGGGEVLSSIKGLPLCTIATEGYRPNVSIAKKKLASLGIKVVRVNKGNQLPLQNNKFDLVINRHESYDPKEVYRVLTPNGIFITQQVGGKECHELNDFLGTHCNLEYDFWNLSYAINQISDYLKISESKTQYLQTTFLDIGAVLYYLKAVMWQIPQFTVLEYFEKLILLEQYISENKKFTCTSERFLIIGRKTK